MLGSLLGLLPVVLTSFLLLLPVQVPQDDSGIQYVDLVDEKPEPGLAWFVLNAFFYVGIVILVTLGLGLFFGWFRLWLKERYPDNAFNGSRDEEAQVVLRLNETPEDELSR